MLPPDVIEINKKLVDYYGIETESSNPIWRVVWSSEEMEYRESTHTPGGMELLFPQVQYLPKYKHYIVDRWILERLVLIPEWQQKELAGNQKSYEPIWVFQNGYDGTYLPAKWEVAQFVIDLVYAAQGKSSVAKYKDEENTPEARQVRINKLQEELFGSESELLGRTITGEAVAYTGPSKIEEKQ